MRSLSFLATLILASGAAASAWGVDLTKIDRTIAKEPAYASKPRYCLLALGEKAKGRVWLALDGDVLYVDRNGNGDLTEKEERVERDRTQEQKEFGVADLSPPGDHTRYTGFRLTVYQSRLPDRIREYPGLAINIDRKNWLASCKEFAARPQEAPIVHFNGPLTFFCPHPPTFAPGKTTHLVVYAGTPGLGEQTYAWRNATDVVGLGGRLFAQIEFPGKNQAGKPLRMTVDLPLDTCCGSTLVGPVAVPEGATPGKAEVTLVPERPVPRLAFATVFVAVARQE
jgi:hypothetical protein